MASVSTKASENPLAYLKPGNNVWEPLDFESYGAIHSNEEFLSDTSIRSRIENNNSHLKEMLLRSLQLPNISFFAGSGTSLAEVNGPSMWGLWKQAMFIDPASSEEEQDFEKLKPIAQNVCSKVHYSEVKNPNIEHFLSQCDAYLNFNEDQEVSAFLNQVKEVILHECSSFLESPESDISSYQNLIQRLARRRIRDPRLKIFTTNYDMCFETAASNLGMVVIDGFSYTRKRKFDGKYFNYDIVRREEKNPEFVEGIIQLYKLHGSVSWERVGNDVYESSSPEAQSAALIYPAKGKYQQAFLQPHLELLSRFLEFLRLPNSCLLISGFGFNDDHLSEPILSAIKSNPSLRLIISDYNAKKNIESAGVDSSLYWDEFSNLSSQGYDIHFINGSFSQLVNLIPNLKALTPADQLVKAVKAVGERS